MDAPNLRTIINKENGWQSFDEVEASLAIK
jgi:hypothetical protein